MTPDAAREAWINRARAVPLMDEVERRGIKLKRVGVEYVGPCPLCGGDDRFAINADKAVWNCRGCTKGGDVIALVRHLDGLTFTAAIEMLAGPPPKKANGKDTASKPREIVTAEFLYHDENGNVVLATERVEYQNPDSTFVLKDGTRKKKFIQKRPDPDRPGKWLYKVQGVRVVPYRLPDVIEAIANDHLVLIPEGEAKCDLLASWNLAATCNAGGAKNWKPEHAAFLKDADVILVPDNDNVGWEHVHLVGASLVGIAKRIRVLVLPGLLPKGDIIDWAKSGGTREQLDELVAKAPDWQAPSDNKADEQKADAERSEKELLDALAKMPRGLEAARERKRLAKEFRVNRSDIDAEVEARRAEAESAAPLYGHWYVEPAPEPADGDALIRDIIRKLQKHNVVSHDNALASTLWAMLAWVHDDVATHSPILLVTSATSGSGKTTLLSVLSFLLPRALKTVEISSAALYRSIQHYQPSFVIDEFDSVLTNEDKTELRSVINSGHTRGDGVLRCITDEHKPELFSTFCPKAIGMIGRKMPLQTLARCIAIEMRRRKKSELVQKFKHADDDELKNLRSRLFRWSMNNAEALRNVDPAMPETFDDRQADNWRVQLAIADLAGDDWGDKARIAARQIEAGSDTRSASVKALAAIKTIFEDTKADAIRSQELVDTLASDPTSEWAEWRNGKPISQNGLARLLKPFKIFPQQIWIDGTQLRGYVRAWFVEAWEREL